MAKNTKVNKNYLWILGIVIIIGVVAVYQLPRKQSQTTDNSSVTTKPNETKTYTSKLLKISIDIPESYSVEEKFGTITLRRIDDKKEITISRSGTNSGALEGYLAELDYRNNINIIQKEPVYISGVSGIKAVIKHPNSTNPDTKTYFFYKNYNIYDVSTNTTDLYSDLDQIARSFRYAP